MSSNELSVQKTIRMVKYIPIQDFLNKACSIVAYGDAEISQKEYYCTLCDPKKEYPFCGDCTTCHSQCIKAGATVATTSEKEFICHCGKELRHEVRKPNENSCNVYSLFDGQSCNFFTCERCQIGLCLICKELCHKDCDGEIQQGNHMFCSCKDDNHNLNDFLFRNEGEFKITNTVKAMGLSSPYQLLYTAFNGSILDNACLFIKEMLQRISEGSAEEGEKYRLLDIFYYLWKLTYNNTDHYFHYKLKSLVDYSKITEKLLAGKLNFYFSYAVYFLYVLELKHDFQFYSKLSSYDYQNSSLNERLQNRALLFQSIPINIQQKYKIYNHYDPKSPTSLVNVALRIADLFSSEDLDVNDHSDMLQFIEFCLKIHIFDQKNLIELIGILYKRYDISANYKIIKNKDYDFLSNITSFTKILYLIAMNYNDLIILNIAEKREEEYNFFIHHYSDFGILLLKMCLKNCVTFSNNFKLKVPLIDTKTILMNNETLKLFIISNNDYMNNIGRLRTDGLEKYFVFVKSLKEIYSQGDSSAQRLSYIMYNFKEKLTLEYDTFFVKNKSCGDIEKRINGYFNEFIMSSIQWISTVRNNERQHKDSLYKDDEFLRFWPKLCKYGKNEFSFIENPNFKDFMCTYINVIKITNLIEIITHLITITYDVNSEQYEKLINNITSFLIIFLFNREGTRFIFKGKTLKRLNHLFKEVKVRHRLLNFYALLFKAMNIHGLFMVNLKFIPVVTGTMLDHLTSLKPYDPEFKFVIIRCIKITNSLSKYYDYEEQKSIITLIITSMKQNGLLKPGLFKKCVKNIFDDKYSLASIKSLLNSDINKNRPVIEVDGYIKEGQTETNYLMKNRGTSRKIKLNEELEEIVRCSEENVYLTNNTEYDIDTMIYFSMFKLFSGNIFYVLHYESFRKVIAYLDEFNDISTFKSILSVNYLNFYERRHLLKYLVNFYLLDIVKTFDIKKYLTTTEYQALREQGDQSCLEKNNYFEQLIAIIDILIQEFESMFYFIYASTESVKVIQKYIESVILNIKFVSEFFFEKKKLYKLDFSNHMTIQFYRLSSSFLKQANLISTILKICTQHTDLVNFKTELLVKYQECQLVGFASRNLKALEDITVVFDMSKIFEIVCREINELGRITDMLHGYDLQKNLHTHDRKIGLNFFPVGLIFLGEYNLIYEEYLEKQSEIRKKYYKDDMMSDVYNKYLGEFFDIKNTNFLGIMGIISSEDTSNYRHLLSNYFISYINSNKFISERFDSALLTMATKLLYFDTSNTQETLYQILENDTNFFPNFYCVLNRFVTLSFTTAKNFNMQHKYFNYINLKAQLMLQFIQFLSEGFNTQFKDKIINGIENKTKTEYHIFTDEVLYELHRYTNEDGGEKDMAVLRVVRNFLNRIAKAEEEGQAGINDSNILLESHGFNLLKDTVKLNQLDVKQRAPLVEHGEEEAVEDQPDNEACGSVVEYSTYEIDNEVTDIAVDPKYSDLPLAEIKFYQYCYKTLLYSRKYIMLDSKIPSDLPNDNLIILSTNMINILIEYNGICRSEDTLVIELLKATKDDRFWRQIRDVLFNREEGYSKERWRILRMAKINYLKLIISIMQNETFKDLVPMINKKIGLINLFEEIIFYMEMMLDDHKRGKRIEKSSTLKDSSIVDQLKYYYIHYPRFQKSQKLEFCITAFRYIKIIGDIYKVNGIEMYYEKHEAMLKRSLNKIDTNETSFASLTGYNIYKFLSHIVVIVEVRIARELENDSTEYKNQTLFFVRSPITFLLSQQTKQEFIDNVDRTNGSTKLNGLFNKCDYFLYEMFYNYNKAIHNSSSALIKSIRMYYLELFNYLFIIIQQIILIAVFYKGEVARADDPSKNVEVELFTDEFRMKLVDGSRILSIIHIIYVIVVIGIWIRYYWELAYQQLIMDAFGIKFLITTDDSKKKTKFIKFTDDDFTKDNKDLLERINDDISIWWKIYYGLYEVTVSNRVVNMFIFTFICLLIYLIRQLNIFLILPVLFIANLIELLWNIFYAVQLKWKQLVMVLVFTYLLVYFFSWLSFFHLYELFPGEDASVVRNGTTVPESVCTSSIQCWMNMVNYGVRAGGGMGDNLPKVSWYQSANMFVALFFFNMAFQIIIVLVLGNIFLGIIVDAFTDLRDMKNLFDNDVENICFVCQMTRDRATSKAVDFDHHTSKKHHLWNYVDFIIYLFVNNPNNFNQFELEAYNKLKDGDMSWVPIEDNESE
jgi:hypothetical protein